MPKLKPETQRARQENILDAAERCFARSGFHGSTMSDICREAGISAGALYVHFRSKEALIAGIAERNRAIIADQFAELRKAPDLNAALAALGRHYAIEESHHKRALGIEIAAEASRNEVVGETFRALDRFVLDSFEDVLARAAAEGRVETELDPRTLAQLILVIGDGYIWRRAVDPDFDAAGFLPSIMTVIGKLLRPVPPTAEQPELDRDFDPKSEPGSASTDRSSSEVAP